MAATVTPNLTDITLGEAADASYWTGTDGASTEIFRQGSASQGWIVSKNANESSLFDSFSKNGLVDMSAAGTHLYITVRCDIAPYIDYLRVGLSSDTAHGSGTTGTKWWTLVDHTSNLEWFGEWRTFILDVNDTTRYYAATSSGTLDLTKITDIRFQVDNSNSGNIRSIENTYIDCIRFGTGLTITGTAWDWDDVATIDSNNNYKYDIIQKVGPGVFKVQGKLTVGNGATTTTPLSSNETLFFGDPSTEGVSGGPLGVMAADLYALTFQGAGCTVDFNNVSFLAGANTPFTVDLDDTNLPSNSVDWNGGTILGAAKVYLKSSQSYRNMSFVGCQQIVPSTSMFEDNIISGFITDTASADYGALYWPGGTTVKNCTFINCIDAIEVTQTTNQTYDGLVFTDCDFDTHLNNGGVDIDISKNNGADPDSYRSTGGGTVTYVGASVTLTVHAITSAGGNIENANVFLKASSAAGPFPYEESVTIANSGTTATVTHNSHGMASGDHVLIEGASLQANNGVFEITVSDSNTYTYTMLSSPGSSPTGTITSTFVALVGLTNASGLKTDSRVYPTDQPVIGQVRKGSGTPFYKTANLIGTIDSEDGFTATAVMILDE